MPRFLTWFAALLFLLSILSQNPLLFLLSVLLGLVGLITELWGRYALAGVTYVRRLGAKRIFVGEEIDLWIELVNAKPLPLAWLKVEDEFPGEIELVKGQLSFSHKETRRILQNLVSLRFYERLRKHYRLRAIHRGALEFGPAEITSGDMFGFQTQQQTVTEVDWLIVYPKVVPVTALGLPARHPFGDATTTRRFSEDPLRVMGVRAYAPGDSPRRIHWKATARRNELQTKVFEPGATQTTAVFLDIQTLPYGYQGVVPEYLELGVTAAASVARYLLDAREAVGLYANGSRRNERDLVRLPPARRPARWFEILDTLARLNYLPSLPLEAYLRAELTQLPFGTSFVVVTPVVTERLGATLLDLDRAGHPVTLLSIGEVAPANVPDEIRQYWIGGREAYVGLAALELS